MVGVSIAFGNVMLKEVYDADGDGTIDGPSLPKRGIASDTLRYSDDAEEQPNSETYVKLKEKQLPGNYGSSVIRVKFDLYGYTVGCKGFGKIYKNGVEHGTEQIVSSDSYETKSEDLTFTGGDLIQLYAHKTPTCADETAKVRNFRIYADDELDTEAW